MNVDKEINQCTCKDCLINPDGNIAQEHYQINFILSELNEKQRRLYVAREAKLIGHGGIRKLSIISGISEKTISKGMVELEKRKTTKGIRKPGAGRPSKKKTTTSASLC